MIPFTIKSYAKLNLSLYVGRPLPSGRHPISSIFQTIDFFDLIEISPGTATSLEFISESPIPNENTCSKILSELAPILTKEWHIKIKKNIPQGGGLGGGSSNAATLLTALIQLENIHLSTNDQARVCSTIGSDVPFFLTTGRALVSGTGEKITPLTKQPGWVVLICPNIHCDTGKIYRMFDTQNTFDDLNERHDYNNHTIGYNALLPAAIQCEPELQAVLKECKLHTNQPIYFSGSGSTFYILCNSKDQQKTIAQSLSANTPYTIISTHTIQH